MYIYSTVFRENSKKCYINAVREKENNIRQLHYIISIYTRSATLFSYLTTVLVRTRIHNNIIILYTPH